MAADFGPRDAMCGSRTAKTRIGSRVVTTGAWAGYECALRCVPRTMADARHPVGDAGARRSEACCHLAGESWTLPGRRRGEDERSRIEDFEDLLATVATRAEARSPTTGNRTPSHAVQNLGTMGPIG